MFGIAAVREPIHTFYRLYPELSDGLLQKMLWIIRLSDWYREEECFLL